VAKVPLNSNQATNPSVNCNWCIVSLHRYVTRRLHKVRRWWSNANSRTTVDVQVFSDSSFWTCYKV